MIDVIAPIKRKGVITAVLDTSAKGRLGFRSTPSACLTLDHEGIVGNRHRGWLRPADARVPYLKRGTPIRNERHLSIVSAEDLAEVARRLEIDRLEPGWIGANVVVTGIPNWSFIPRGTHLFTPGGAILTVTDQNAPCTLAGTAIAEALPDRNDLVLAFPKHAQGLRGIVATVEHPGTIEPGPIEARMPVQWLYR